MKTKIRKWITWVLGGSALLCLGCSTFSEGGGRVGITWETRNSAYFWNDSDGDKQGNSSKAGMKSDLLEKLLDSETEDEKTPE